MKNLKFVFNFTVLLLLSNYAISQKSKVVDTRDSLIKKSLIARNFSFVTNFVGETYTGKPLLSPDYKLTVSSETLVADLPSILSYQNIASTNFASVYKLNSLNYYYKAMTIDKKGYYVLIQPVDDKVISSLILNIDLKGNCNLSLIKNDKKVIKYNGYLVFNK